MVKFLAVMGLAAASSFAPASAQRPAPAFEVTSIQLYQAEDLDRLLPDVDPLTVYIDAIKDLTAKRLEQAKGQAGVSGTIFIALKPPNKTRIWILSPSNKFPAQLKSSLEAELVKLPPNMKLSGVFLLGLPFNAWGGGEKWPADNPAPIPAEWEAQIPPEGIALNDAFLLRVWPD